MSNLGVSFQGFSEEFDLDRRAGELHKQGSTIRLPEQLLQLLMLLMERPGQIVTREEIRRSLWSDSFVNFEDSINAAIKRLRDSLGDSAEDPRYIETLPGHGYRLVIPAERIAPFPAASADAVAFEKPRIAVIPFENLSDDPAERSLADGLTDSLITILAKVPKLHVKPLLSVRNYKSSGQSVVAMGKKMKVGVVLHGAVAQSGHRVRVTVRLLRVATEEHLWAECYDHEGDDVLAFQSHVAGTIAQQVLDAVQVSAKVRTPSRLLTPGHRRFVTNPRSCRPAAYETALKARYVFKDFTDDGLWKARQYWKKAVAEDPGYAQAYAGLAESYHMLGIKGLLPATDALAQAREAAVRALEIDDSLSEAHTALACTLMLDWNWAEAGREFERAIQLHPNLATGNPCHYAEYLMAIGRPAEAIAEIERAQETQPLSLFLSVILGWVYYGCRDYDRALRQHQKVLAFDPHFALTHVCLGLDYSQKQWYSAAIKECRKARSLDSTKCALSALGYAYAMAGFSDKAHQILDELRRLLRASYAPPYAFATIYAGLRENDAAFDWLGRAFEMRDPRMIWLKWDPQFDNLRLDPRFQKLLSGMGLQSPEKHTADIPLERPRKVVTPVVEAR